MWKAPPITVTPQERIVLECRVNAHKTPVRDQRRAKIILLAANGMPSRQIAREVAMHESNVAKWRNRFLKEGLDGLIDAPRPGKPRIFGHDERMKIAAAATSEKESNDPVATWTYDELADYLQKTEGICISASQLWRILTSMHIRLDKVRGWLNRRDDPNFWDRVRDVVGLYLNPPREKVLVLSVDEKTAIQANERRYPDQTPKSGRSRRREFEYRRHGTVSLLAALDVHSGQVLATDIAKNNSKTFCIFLEEIDQVVDPTMEIHLIMDNGSSHTSKATKAWLSQHSRFVVHHTPPHASWVNQVELFFSILQRKVIRNGSFVSRQDLLDKLLRFIADYDQTAKPFRWTYAADPLMAE